MDISDRNGNRVELAYKDKLLSKIRNGTETHVELFHQTIAGKTRLVEIQQHLKNGQTISLMRFGYNEEAELHTATDRTYQPFIYEYEDHLMTRETNRNKLSFYFEYEGAGTTARCVHTWGDGNIYERWLEYLPKSRITKVRDGLGGETIYHYNELDLVTKIFDPNGSIVQFEYGESGELLKEVDELGRARIYAYDEQLNCVGVTQEDGSKRNIAFDEFCQPLTILDECGAQWQREYDGHGNLIASINPLGAQREYEYGAKGDLVKLRDALGNETKFEWTNSGQISSIIRPRGGKTSYSYNERDLLEDIYDISTGLKIKYSYDDAGRIRKISEINARNQINAVQRFEYDDQDNLVSVTDTLGNRTLYTYSGYDKLAGRTDALGYKRRYKYDNEERLIQLTNEREESYLFEYDLLHRLISETGFDGAKTVYKYSQANEIVYQKDALGREIFYQYDAIGRLVKRLSSDALTSNFEYDGCGRITRATNSNGEIKLVYDAAWRLVSEEQNGRVISYEYDAEDNRTSRKVKDGEKISGSVEYEFDSEGQFAGVKIAGNSLEFRRDQAGRLTEKILPDGLRESFDYDVNGRLESQKISVGANGREILRRGYDWDALGNLTQVSDSLRGTRRYAYNAIERLSRVERLISGQTINYPEEKQNLPKSANNIPADKRLWQSDSSAGKDFNQISEIEEFRYDGDGNLTERNSNVRGSIKFSYGKGDRLNEREKIRYFYDAVGNLVEKQKPDGETVRYEYDTDNQLTAISTGNGGTIEFKYDAFGRRIAKISNRGVTGFLWDGDVLLGEENDSFCEYVHEGFVPLAKVRNFEVQIYHTDYLGTPKEVTDLRGEIVWQGNYDEYGNVSEIRAQTVQPIRFQGQYEDAETGLFYNRFRYYDADSGRYINQDPIGLFGGDNLYAYAWNPLMWLDPYGLVKAPANLPNTPGIYVLTDPKTKRSYVGQGVNMNDRISSTTHAKAQKLLNTPGVRVQYVPVDLGTASTDADKRRILSRYEQIELEKQRSRGFTMLNSIQAEQPKKRSRNQALITTHNAEGGKRRRTC